MKTKEIFYLGLDVDDKKYHGFALAVTTGEFIEFVCAPNAGAFRKKVKVLGLSNQQLKICYEAGYLGFSLCRQLRKFGFDCEVIAPSLIPSCKGNKVKTDRLDAEKLARYYLGQLLTIVHVPDEDQEADRDLLRSRKFMVDSLSSIKKHINSMTRRLGWNYKEEDSGKKNWTVAYVSWLKEKISETKNLNIKANLEILLRQYDGCNERINEYNNEIEKMCEQPQYKKQVRALSSYRGIKKQTALVLITELGDIRRFKHPRELTSYAGLDIIERSSGGNERKFGISKDGNKFIRTAVVESCQTVSRPVVVSRPILQRRMQVDSKYVEIADRCMKRLNEKSRRLLAKGKAKNKVKVACAREMLGFIWESLTATAKSS